MEAPLEDGRRNIGTAMEQDEEGCVNLGMEKERRRTRYSLAGQDGNRWLRRGPRDGQRGWVGEKGPERR